MTIGPLQLVALGFDHPNFTGEIRAELARLHESDTVNVVDAIAIYKDHNGEMELEHLSNLSKDEAIEMGSTICALIGLGIEGESGFVRGAENGAAIAADGDLDVFSDEAAWDVLDDIPNDSAAAVLLLEHEWAVPLRDAVLRAGGHRIGDTFVSAVDLVAIGLAGKDEAIDVPSAPVTAAR
jgi:uncharacterized membrane protein